MGAKGERGNGAELRTARALDVLLTEDRPGLEVARGRCRGFLSMRWRAFRLTRWLLPGAVREDLTALLAWFAAVRLAGEPALRSRLRRVLEEVETGEPTSALAVALRPAVHGHQLSLVQLRGPLAEHEKTETLRTFESRTALLAHARRLATPEARVLLRVVGESSEKSLLLGDALAVGLLLTHWLERLPADVARGHVHVAVDDLASRDLDLLSLERVVQSGEDARLRATVQDAVQAARTELAKGWPLCVELGPWRGRLLAFTLRWHAATLSAIEMRGYRVPAAGVPAGWLRALACLVASAAGTRVPWS